MNKKIKTIGIIALAGVVEEEKINTAKEYLENLGYNVKLSANIYDKNRYLAGCDETKLNELYKFFQDPEIDLILNARGGYGSIRLVNKIDYDIIKSNPKPFVGFSDITALLLMIYKKTGLITYHGAMASSDFSFCKKGLFSQKSLWQALSSDALKYTGDKIYFDGKASGIIWGGNLATTASLCGLDFIPDKDFVFFTEDLNEPVYKIDKMFQQLFNIDKFNKYCKGIVLGEFLSVDNELWLEEYFQELAQNLEIPFVGGFKITHSLDKMTVPIGRDCLLHAGSLVIN